MPELNGHAKPPPRLVVEWLAEHQVVNLQFTPADFRTWDFVLAVLDMARQKAEQQQRLALGAALQHQMEQVAADKRMASQILRSR